MPDDALVDTDVASTLYATRFAVVPVDSDVAVEYARLRSATEGLGRPVADNDVWIAASATANGRGEPMQRRIGQTGTGSAALERMP
jgi:hypothetical protein